MKNTLKIQVTGKDIKNGKRGDCNKCPIALAVGRKTGGWASVSDDILTLRGVYSVPEEVNYFTEDFDHGKKVKPFSFVMRIC